MVNITYRFVLLFFSVFSGTLDTQASQLETPAFPIEQALVAAQRHVAVEKLELSNMYLAKAEWHPRSGLVSFWRIEWRTNEPVKGGYLFVSVSADGKIAHGWGK